MDSLIFCKKVATDPTRSSYTDRDWSNAREVYSKTTFENYIVFNKKTLIKIQDKNGNTMERTVIFKFNPNADFEYFTSASTIHDGTLLFELDCIKQCMINVLTATTYFKGNKSELRNDSMFIYTIGNFVVVNEFDESKFATTEKPFLQQRTTVMLPLISEIINN